MCYLVREQQAAAAEGGTATLPPPLDRVRSRWAGAAAALVIGGFALAALVAPRSTATVPDVSPTGAPAPIASRMAKLPTAAGGEQTALPMDDGVPTAAADTPRAGLGNCHHGM